MQPIFLRSPTGDAEVYAHGGHVARFTPHGQAPVLFLSPHSKFAPGEAIRGGVPVIFPWFGDDPDGKGRPAHGFARRTAWARADDGQDPARASFTLVDSGATRTLWPHRFALRIDVAVGAALTLTLTVENRDAHAFRCEPALHTYLAVSDVHRVQLTGLERAPYRDKVAGAAACPPTGAPLTFTAETDRVYRVADATCRVRDPGLGRTLQVAQRNVRSTIVWTPWTEKAARMRDLGDAWPGFVCVESGNVGDDALELAPGTSHVMQAVVAVA